MQLPGRNFRSTVALAMCALVLSGAGAALANAAGKQRGDIPRDRISIQLWNFAAYVGFGTDAATQARLEEVLRRLSAIGYRNVEPFTFNGPSS